MADCSELALAVTDIVTMIAAEPGVTTLDDVVARLKTFEGLETMNREEVAQYVAEATRGKESHVSEAAQIIAAIKQEARTDVDTRKRIAEYEKHLREGTLPETNPRTGEPTTATAELRAIRDGLLKKIKKSDPAKLQRVEKSIARLEEIAQELDTGTYEIPLVSESRTKESNELKRKRFELHRERLAVNQRIDALKPKEKWEKRREFFDIPRALKASVDFSAPGRQAKFFVLSRPIEAAKHLAPMFKAAFSSQKEFEIMEAIHNHPEAGDMHIGGLYLAPLEASGAADYTAKEEAFRSDIASKIPVIGPLIAGSNRAYNAYLNSLRAGLFLTLKKQLASETPTKQELKDIAELVNVATGRGHRFAGEAGDVLMFSQRYAASRIQLAFARPLAKAEGGILQKGTAKNIIAKEYGRMLIGASVVVFMAKLFGWDQEEDIISSDFGKIRFGKTRLDLFGGMQAPLSLTAKVATGVTKSAVTGNISHLVGEGFKPNDVRDELARRLFWFKMNPTGGALVSIAARENVIGENRNIRTKEGALGIAEDLLIPLAPMEVYETMKEQGMDPGLALAILAIFGEGVQTFPNEQQKEN